MNHEVIFLAVLIATVITGEPLDALVDLAVLLEIAPLSEAHVAQVTGVRLHLGVAAHVRGELGESQQDTVAGAVVVQTFKKVIDTVAVGTSDGVQGEQFRRGYVVFTRLLQELQSNCSLHYLDVPCWLQVCLLYEVG